MDTPKIAEQIDPFLVRKRIALLLTPVDFGGAERVSLSFLQHHNQPDTSIHPILLCRPWVTDNVFVNALQKDGITFSTVPTRRRPREEGSDYLRLFRCAVAVYKKMKNGNFDLVHTNGYFADTIGVIAAKLLRVPVITTCHGFISNTRRFRLYNALNIFAIRFMDRVIVVSEKMKNDLIANGIESEKIHVVQNAVEPASGGNDRSRLRNHIRDRFGMKEKDLVLGYVGRISEEKGLKFLIEAGAELLSKGSIPLRILIIGDGPQASKMQKLVHDAGMKDIVCFAGFQANIGEILPALDIFVLPSLTEGTSMALLEAMAHGLPVIATKVGGTPKVVTTDKNGLLIPKASPREIASAVELLYNEPMLRKSLGVAAKQTVSQKFGIHQWLEQIEAIYVDVLHQRRSQYERIHGNYTKKN